MVQPERVFNAFNLMNELFLSILGRMSFDVVNPWSSQHEQVSRNMSCLSKANLQITVGVGVPAFSGHPFKKFFIKCSIFKRKHFVYNGLSLRRNLSTVGLEVGWGGGCTSSETELAKNIA